VVAPVLSEDEWDILLVDGATRRGAPFAGSRCDAWRWGCPGTASVLLVGTNLGLCQEHLEQLRARAAALGATLTASTRLVYVVTDAEGRIRVWRRLGNQWRERPDPRITAPGTVQGGGRGPAVRA